jgi:hypothetical protein
LESFTRDPIGYRDGANFYSLFLSLRSVDPSGLSISDSIGLNCTSVEDSFKISIFNDDEKGRLNGGAGKYLDGMGNFFKNLRKKIPLPEIDFSLEVAWKTKTCNEDCPCDRKAVRRFDEAKISGQFNMDWNGMVIPGVTPPGTWIDLSADIHFNSSFERESGGCDNVDKRHLCVKLGGEISVSLCGGAPGVLQGCIKASLECNVGWCGSGDGSSKNGGGCEWEISTNGCVGWWCRERAWLSGTF